MNKHDSRAGILYQACIDAHCTERQLEVMRLRLSGLTQPEIAASLGITQPAAGIHLARVKRRLEAHARELAERARVPEAPPLPSGFASFYSFFAWMWHTMCHDIREDAVLGGWRRATIWKKPAPPLITNERGEPAFPKVQTYRPEDSVAALESQGIVVR